MSDWSSDATGYLAELARQPAARAPATIGEIWDSEWKRGGLDTISGIGQPMVAATSELSSAIEGATGQPLADYAASKGERLSGSDQDYDAGVMARLVDTLPEDKRKAIEPLKDVRLNAAKKAQKIEADAGDVASATYGLSGHAVAFIAGIARQTADPVNIAAMVATAPLGGEGGIGVAALARFAGREALSNAAAQALVEPVIEPARRDLGLDAGFGRAAGNIVEAGIGGGILGGLFHAAGRGLRSLRGEKPVERVAPEGAITPSEPELRGNESGTAPVARPDPAPAGPLAPVRPSEQFAPDDFHAAGDLAMRDHVVDAMSPIDTPAGRFEHAAKVEETARRLDSVTGFQAFHGTPHDFDRFDIERIGTGEGAQKYGPGLYFAESKSVADSYSRMSPISATGAETLARDTLLTNGGDRQKAAAQLREFASRQPDRQREQMQLDAATVLESDVAISARSNVYQVRINADPAKFLDWDKPFNEQSPDVVDALGKLRTLLATGPDNRAARGSLTPQSAFMLDDLASVEPYSFRKQMEYDFDPITASRLFSEAGIPGIKYLDQGSRGSGDGSRNFVVFDDRHVEITHKNNEPVRLADVPFPEAFKIKTEGSPDTAAVKSIDVKAKAPSGRAAADPQTWSLNEFLASVGGLRPDPELSAIFGNKRGPFVPGFGQLIRKGGKTIDDALTAAKEAGYLFDAHDVGNGEAGVSGRTGLGLIPRDLLDVLDAENRGQKLYKAGHEATVKIDAGRAADDVLAELDHELHASGGGDIAVDPVIGRRVVEIVRKEGESDVLAAYERAIMEDAERYEGLAAARSKDAKLQKIPGWDPDEPGAASRDGATDPQQRGQAERAGQKDGRSDGAAARTSGDGAGTPRELGDPAIAADAARALEDAGGDFEITLQNPDGTTRTLKATDALREVEADARAADELNACIAGAALEEAPF